MVEIGEGDDSMISRHQLEKTGKPTNEYPHWHSRELFHM